MTMTSVPTTDTQLRAPADLKPGDQVRCDRLEVDADEGTYAEVLYTHSSHSVLYGGTATLVVFQLPDADTFAETFTADAGPLPIASEAELAEVKQDAHRRTVAAQLRELAELIVARKLPIDRSTSLSLRVADQAELEHVAELLNTKVEKPYGDRRREVNWPVGHQSYETGLHVEWYLYAPAEPETVGPREVDNGDPAAVIPDGVDGQPVGKMPARRSPRLP